MLGDPETVHYGLVPRTNRGIFAVNELPDLAERIQVALLNVLEERDIQVRGYQLRLPLDLLMVASANPEDYTNRGRIITPLKDRFGAEVRTHYPLTLDDELALVAQEAAVLWDDASHSAPLVPQHFARSDWAVCSGRSATPPASRSAFRCFRPVCHRGVETVAASAVPPRGHRRRDGRRSPSMRPAGGDPASRGKVEFDDADEGREFEVARSPATPRDCQRPTEPGWPALRPAAAPRAFRRRPTRRGRGDTVSADSPPRADRIGAGLGRPAGTAGAGALAKVPRLSGSHAAVVEFALEGLYLNKRLAKRDLRSSDGLWCLTAQFVFVILDLMPLATVSQDHQAVVSRRPERRAQRKRAPRRGVLRESRNDFVGSGAGPCAKSRSISLMRSAGDERRDERSREEAM